MPKHPTSPGTRTDTAFVQSQGSYWQRDGQMRDTAHEFQTQPPVPERATIVILGAGFAGVTTAIEIRAREPDADVIVLEKNVVGYGASGRNGGLMSPLPAPIWLMTAHQNDDHTWALVEFNRRVKQTAAWLKDTIGHDEVRAAPLNIEAQGRLTNAALGRISRTLTGLQIDHALSRPNPTSNKRTLNLDAHTIHPYKLTQDLAAFATTQGIAIYHGIDVQRIDETSTGSRITYVPTSPNAEDPTQSPQTRSTIDATTVVICTNAYTADIKNLETVKAKPVYNFMVATKPHPDRIAKDAFTVELNHAYAFYRTHNERLIFGGIEKLKNDDGGDFGVPSKVIAQLKKHIASSAPEFKDIEFDHAWSGKYHMTSVDLPIIRRAKTNTSIVFNVGYGGTGVAMTMTCARFAAAIALDKPFQTSDDKRLYKVMTATRLPVTSAASFGIGCLVDVLRTPFIGHPKPLS